MCAVHIAVAIPGFLVLDKSKGYDARPNAVFILPSLKDRTSPPGYGRPIPAGKNSMTRPLPQMTPLLPPVFFLATFHLTPGGNPPSVP